MKKENIKIYLLMLNYMKQVSIIFTLFFMWLASCHYLVYNINNTAANACFYGGASVLVLAALTAPRLRDIIGRVKL